MSQQAESRQQPEMAIQAQQVLWIAAPMPFVDYLRSSETACVFECCFFDAFEVCEEYAFNWLMAHSLDEGELCEKQLCRIIDLIMDTSLPVCLHNTCLLGVNRDELYILLDNMRGALQGALERARNSQD